jgi:replicative DNA helicase
VANDLKDLALAEDVPIVAVVAADREGLRAQRVRMHHLRGSSALAYESDVTLILNNKYRIVAKKSITFNSFQAQEFRNWVVCTLEKNRSGLDLIDLEFRAYFGHAAFDPAGNVVAETLVDERIEE